MIRFVTYIIINNEIASANENCSEWLLSYCKRRSCNTCNLYIKKRSISGYTCYYTYIKETMRHIRFILCTK